MDKQIIDAFAFDHAGKGETSLMMALCPEGVDMASFDDKLWYARSAQEATPAFGQRGVEMILRRLKTILT